MNEFTFVFNLEPYILKNQDGTLEKDSQKMSLILCKSLREAGISSPILAISSNGNMPDEKTLSELKKLGVDFYEDVINKYPYNGYFNKVYGYGFLSTKVTTPYVCFIDIDVIFLKSDFFDRIKNLLKTYDVVSAMGFWYTDIERNTSIDDQRSILTCACEEDKKYLLLNYGLTERNWVPSGILFLKTDNMLNFVMDKWKIRVGGNVE